MFALNNDHQHIDSEIDLHGLQGREVTSLIENLIRLTQNKLNNGIVNPNEGENGHILKIIAGAGHHSRGGIPVLRFKVKKYLEAEEYDFYEVTQHGVFLVKLDVEK